MQISLSPQVTLQLTHNSLTDGGAVLLDSSGEPYYELDEVGLRLWQLLAQNGDFDAAIAQLLKEVEISEGELRREMRELLEDMAQADLVAWE